MKVRCIFYFPTAPRPCSTQADRARGQARPSGLPRFRFRGLVRAHQEKTHACPELRPRACPEPGRAASAEPMASANIGTVRRSRPRRASFRPKSCHPVTKGSNPRKRWGCGVTGRVTGCRLSHPGCRARGWRFAPASAPPAPGLPVAARPGAILVGKVSPCRFGRKPAERLGLRGERPGDGVSLVSPGLSGKGC